jgi:glycosyltransferase involved in cell wall biosynthesis
MLFEQLVLPLTTFGTHLLNLSGPAPLLKRDQSVVLFDASTFRYPRTFSKRFVAWYRLLFWVLSRTAKNIFTISDFSARDIAEVLHLRRSRLRLALCGADHALRSTPKRPKMDLPAEYVLCIGTLAARKNLIPVVRSLSASGINTVVVGAAGKSKVFGNSSGLSVESDNVTVAGRLTDEEVNWLLDHAIALVFPSLYEGFGLPVVEAQMRGCPVVCADRSSLPEVTDGSALLFNPDEPDAVAGLVHMLAADRDLRISLIEKGRRNASRFTWRRTATAIIETLAPPGGAL